MDNDIKNEVVDKLLVDLAKCKNSYEEKYIET